MTTWLRMGQAMAQLNVSRKTMRKYCVQGHVTADKLPGGHWRIDESSIDALLGVTHQEVLAHMRKLRL